MALEDNPSTVEQLLHYPEFDADLCLHGGWEFSTCNACAERCPRDTITLSSEMLEFDPESCDGCGACLPACPEQAISLDDGFDIRELKISDWLSLYCERSPAADDFNQTVCLNRIGFEDLARLYIDGIRVISISTADCESCDRAVPQTFEANVSDMNRLLRSRGKEELRVENPGLAEWRRETRSRLYGMSRSGLNKRSLFRRVLGSMEEKVADSQQTDAAESGAGIAQLFPATGPESVLPAQPDIEAERCSGCMDCLRTCPRDVFVTAESDSNDIVSLEAEPARCNGCGLCQDICSDGAISITRFEPESHVAIGLLRHRCRSCGVDFQQNPLLGQQQTHCKICRHVNHNANLFQVIGDS